MMQPFINCKDETDETDETDIKVSILYIFLFKIECLKIFYIK